MKTLFRFVESTNKEFKELYSSFQFFYVGSKKDLTRGKVVPVDMFGNKLFETWELSTIVKVENTDYTLTLHTRNNVYVFLKVSNIG